MIPRLDLNANPEDIDLHELMGSVASEAARVLGKLDRETTSEGESSLDDQADALFDLISPALCEQSTFVCFAVLASLLTQAIEQVNETLESPLIVKQRRGQGRDNTKASKFTTH